MLQHEFTQQQLRKLLLFWTGASIPPLEGPFRSEHCDMTIAKMIKKKRSGGNEGVLLPEAQTCDKHLYLPEYTSLAEVPYSYSY
jgi:hypothetical protein